MANELTPTDSGGNKFEILKRKNIFGAECWSSRDLAKILDYDDYRNFEEVIEKAKIACANSNQNTEDHFGMFTEMIVIGKGGQRPVDTIMMTRYACYLAIQNADPSKEIVAHGQTYFAVQTRRQEQVDESTEDGKRLLLRNEMRSHNKKLVAAAHDAGVVSSIDYAIFQNHGYMGLYGGMTAQDIQRTKGLQPGESILDHMGSTELAANLFRATQTEDKLRRDQIFGKAQANAAHHAVGEAVRKTIEDLGGAMPETLPKAENIKKLEQKKKKGLPKPPSN